MTAKATANSDDNFVDRRRDASGCQAYKLEADGGQEQNENTRQSSPADPSCAHVCTRTVRLTGLLECGGTHLFDNCVVLLQGFCGLTNLSLTPRVLLSFGPA